MMGSPVVDLASVLLGLLVGSLVMLLLLVDPPRQEVVKLA